MTDLRDFLYLDTVKLYSFVSQIDGGIVSQINETIRKHGGLSAGIEIGIPSLGGKVEAGKQTENEKQQTMQLTDPAYFNVLYNYLENESLLQDISMIDIEKRNSLKEGQFIEVEGLAEPPAVESWIQRVRALIDFIDNNIKLFSQLQSKGKGQNSLSKQQMGLFKRMLNFLEEYIQISRKDPEKQFVRVVMDGQSFNVWCSLLPTFATIPLENTLPANVTIIGRVEKVIEKEQIYKIVDLSKFNQPTDVSKLLDALNALTTTIGQKEIREDDLQAKYPDILVTPIAIYR